MPEASETSVAARVGGTVLISRACALLGVSKRTVYYWIQAGRLRTVRTMCGSQRVVVDDVYRVAAARAAETAEVAQAR